LQSDASAGRSPHDTGQFSLAGAQPKTALCFDGQRWGVPSGREPTTHILKPQSGEFDGHAENEHLCLALARSLGLPVARSEVRQFEDVTAIVIERYDRVHIATLASTRAALAAAKAAEAAMYGESDQPDGAAMAARAAADAAEAAASAQALSEFSKTTATYRVHQEDFCQALSVHPALKYQNDGGPGPREITDLLRAHVAGAQRSKDRDSPTAYEEDAATFIDALILNWLIGGTDAHAKNYSILIGGGGLVRLAPLYDLASIFAYANIDPGKATLAMKIGGEYRLRNIGLPEWRKLAVEIRTDGDKLIDRIRSMAGELPDRLADEVRRLSATGVRHRVIDTLGRELPRRAVFAAKL
jgi:serine/threonine-protein kinase HipA